MEANTVDEAMQKNFKANVRGVATETGRREAAERRANEHRLMETLRGLIEGSSATTSA